MNKIITLGDIFRNIETEEKAFKFLDYIKKLQKQEQEIERLNKEVEKYKKRCYEALKLIRDNYGLLDKYGIDMLDDILNGE